MNEIIDLIKDDLDDVLKKHLTDIVLSSDTISTKALSDIQQVLKHSENKSDFDIVEEIVCIFEKYNINVGNCHDFG